MVGPLASGLGRRFAATRELIASTEALWLTSPPASEVRRKLKVDRLEALYEAAYLRIFSDWEAFLEDGTTRFMAGYESASYQPVPVMGRSLLPTISGALAELLCENRSTPRDYLLWHNPVEVANRTSRWLVGSPVEAVCRTNADEIARYVAIRHHIAHGSVDTREKFKVAARYIAASDCGGRPGRLLRADDIADPLNRPRWIVSISNRLLDLASKIVA